MPMPEKMGYVFTDLQKQTIIANLQEIVTIITGIKKVQLTAKERQGASSVDNVRLPYVIKGEQLAQTYVELRPGYLSLADCTNNLKTTQDGVEIKNHVNQMVDVLTDFLLAEEHFAFEYMRKFYNNGKEAEGTPTPGVDAVIDALAPLFEKQGSSGTNLPEVTPP